MARCRPKAPASARAARSSIRLPAHAGAATAAPAVEQPPVIAYPARVLVVDDNVDAAESLAMLLQSDGHTVSVAHNGVDAVERAEAWRPDIVVLDVGLPGMNGYEVASALRQRGEACPELIAVTGYGQAADTQARAGSRLPLSPGEARGRARPHHRHRAVRREPASPRRAGAV